MAPTRLDLTPEQTRLYDALMVKGVKYIRVDAGSGYAVADAVALERHGMVLLDRREYVGSAMVACVVKPALGAKRQKLAPSPAPRPRLGTGTEVVVLRTRHGWCGGRISGKIVEEFDDGCVVFDETFGIKYEVEHHRDVRVIRKKG